MFLMPTIGASIHVIQKFLFECSAMGVTDVHKFQKPFFFTWLGSAGLFVILLLNLSQSYRVKIFGNKASMKSIMLIGVSTFFNLSAGALANFSSLYLNYSVSLMLRSSTLIFGAVISVSYLKRPILRHQLVGVCLTVCSIVLVGSAALFSDSKTTHRVAAASTIALHVVIRVMSKSLQAIAMIIEERVMVTLNLTAFELTGLTGAWSFAMSSLFLLPMEDMIDTMKMIANSKEVLIYCVLSIVVFAVWNVLALQITNKASAVARMVFDQLTIVVVWFVQLGIHWGVTGTEYEEKFGKAGEEWTKWSWLQLIGFCVMVFGACVYQNIVTVPCSASADRRVPAALVKQNDELSASDSKL